MGCAPHHRHFVAELLPKGKPIKEALIYYFKRFATVRYETGNARPPGGSLKQRHLFKIQRLYIRR